MALAKHVTEGTVAFESLRQHDVYDGKSTGKYTVTLMLSSEDAKKLEENGVKMKDYEGTPQRKFQTQYSVPIINPDGTPFEDVVTRGSKVRIQYQYGPAHPTHGVST